MSKMLQGKTFPNKGQQDSSYLLVGLAIISYKTAVRYDIPVHNSVAWKNKGLDNKAKNDSW